MNSDDVRHALLASLDSIQEVVNDLLVKSENDDKLIKSFNGIVSTRTRQIAERDSEILKLKRIIEILEPDAAIRDQLLYDQGESLGTSSPSVAQTCITNMDNSPESLQWV